MKVFNKFVLISSIATLAAASAGCQGRPFGPGNSGNGGSGGGGGAQSVLPATVASTIPAAAAVGAALNTKLAATFSEPMDPATLTAATFTVASPDGTPVAGTVSYDAGSMTAIFAPTANLTPSTAYTASIATGVANIAEVGLAANYVWTFTSGTSPDTAAPIPHAVTPVAAAAGVPVGNQLAAVFGKAMNPATINSSTFKVSGPGGVPVPGTVTYNAGTTTATFTPASPLVAGDEYHATITTGAQDLSGNALAVPYAWAFTTQPAPDTDAPAVLSTIPAAASTGVSINRQISVTFGEEMNRDTITTATFSMSAPGGSAVLGIVAYAAGGTSATFTPASNLAANTLYTVKVSTGAKDLAGNALASAVVWSFTTSASIAAGPAPVLLGTAGDFVLLAKAAVSTTGTTAITGNVGVSPSAETYLTGFSEALDATNQFATTPLVTGKLYAADMAVPTPANMTTAIGNMQTAYTDAAGRSLPDFTELGAGDISGKTLTPGLYKWGTGVLMTSDVTLSGGANDVWIFQIAQDLTVANGVHVTLQGGALPKNIFWQVAGQAVLGTTSAFKGVILCETQIVLQTGAALNGRALAQTAITLDANAVTQPTP